LPRPRHEVRPHDWKLSIPQDLAAEVDLLLWDPVLQKPRYGGRSELVTQLLRGWLEQQRGGQVLAPAISEGSSL
jgi:metal-responsive CopG/Arc/MetJ family transcriptional regulator